MANRKRKDEPFRAKRNALEILAVQELLHCEKHGIPVNKGLLYKKHCYTRNGGTVCPYLALNSQDRNDGCRYKDE